MNVLKGRSCCGSGEGRSGFAVRAAQASRRCGRAAVLLAVALLACGAWAGSAAALPTVTAKGEAVAIKGFPHTGNILGAGAAVHAEVKISGTEYGGFPPPLIGLSVFLPTGTVIDTHDFPTCPPPVILEQREPRDCPAGSSAGPGGTVYGVVAFGKEIVPETAELEAYLAPGGGIEYIVFGHTPVSLEIPGSQRLVQPGPAAGFGPEFTGSVPLVETVPGAQDASAEAIEFTLGTAIRKHGKVYYYGRVPKHCPSGGFRVKSEFTFAQGGNPEHPETVTVPFRAPCPRS